MWSGKQRQKERTTITEQSCGGSAESTMADVPDHRLVETFRAARKNKSLAVLEGFHPLKHALRFGADIHLAVTRDLEQLERLCNMSAPDVWLRLRELARIVAPPIFERLAPVPPDTGIIAIASRHGVSEDELLLADRSSPLIVLERPTHLGNVGATVRVAGSSGRGRCRHHRPARSMGTRRVAGRCRTAIRRSRDTSGNIRPLARSPNRGASRRRRAGPRRHSR